MSRTCHLFSGAPLVAVACLWASLAADFYQVQLVQPGPSGTLTLSYTLTLFSFCSS